MSLSNSPAVSKSFQSVFARALDRRRALIAAGNTQAYRAFSGEADGLDGVFVDVYGPGAVLIVYEGRAPADFDTKLESASVMEVLRSLGVQAVYLKPFAKDRSRLGGAAPACVMETMPAAGEALPDATVIREWDCNLEVRLHDGLSTGLFLDQRENRAFVAKWVARRARAGAAAGVAPTILNTFAYTCAFSVAAAKAGGVTTSVDVSARYLDWGKRSFSLNAMDASKHRFARMDTFEFFAYARRKGFMYDLVILDPPSFASGSKKKGIKAWSSVNDYARLVGEAAGLLNHRGVIFASTNTQELCRPGRLDREIAKGLMAVRGKPQWIKLPEAPIDFSRETDRFAARAFSVG